jgi:D-serine dehydratase
MAHELVGKQNMAIISGLLTDLDFEFYCLVDSAEIVNQLGQYFSQQQQRLHVLLELGVAGGRTGVRGPQQLEETLAAIEKWHETIVLSGVEIYEGVLKDEAGIRSFLQHAVTVTTQLAKEKRFKRTPVLLSGAGSAWYDVVAEEFSKAKISQPLEIILRPGCYLTHDVGVYKEAQQRIDTNNPVAQKMQSSLQPALQVWAYVQSIPEKNKAILGLGKRDAAFDISLPVPALHYRPGTEKPMPVPAGWEVTKLMDQHAFMHITEGNDIRVGDMIGLDISHPCLTFDKWRWIAVLDADYKVIDAVQTFF